MKNHWKNCLPGGALILALALLPALVFPAPALASSHREAPNVMDDPAIDSTDFYIFRDPQDPTRIVLIANYWPMSEPAGGPNFFHFSPNVRYEIKIDNNGDGVEDITFRFLFTRNVRNGNTFLQNTGGVASITDTNQNVYYTYTLDKVIGPSVNAFGSAVTRIASGLLEAPANVGPKSFPNGYETVSNGAIYGADGGVKVFVGARCDPFFVDLGMIFDLVDLENRGKAPFKGIGGNNDVAGYNVQTLALSIPITSLTANGTAPTLTSDPNAIIGAWTAAYRQATRVYGSPGQTPIETGAWVQVSRLGNPLVNEVVIPLAFKNQFGMTEPKDDVQYGAFVLDPEVGRILTGLFGIAVPPPPRTDLLLLVQGLTGLTKRTGEVISDQIRLNVAITPTPFAAANRLGVIAGDNAGFPNGRRPMDDVVDIELRVIAGVLVSGFNVAPNNTLGDNVDQPDRAFLCCFPYLGTPNSGFDHKHDNPNDPRICPQPTTVSPKVTTEPPVESQ
jgi:hypothetical protein